MRRVREHIHHARLAATVARKVYQNIGIACQRGGVAADINNARGRLPACAGQQRAHLLGLRGFFGLRLSVPGLIALGGVALLPGLGVVVRDVVATQRPRRLARRESIPAYYLRGHAFAH